jgi:hypothetical protein
LKPTTNSLPGLFAILILSVVFLFSCNKEPDLVGLDLLPEGDRLGASFMDTSTIIAYTVYEDSVLTSKMTFGVIGSIYDEVFGKTTASLYTQIKLTTNAPTFGTNPVVDSVVLVLPYYGLFGDSTAMQAFKVYELTDSLSINTKYYSNSPGPAFNEGSLLAEQTFLPRVNDSVVVDTATKVIPQLRLKFKPLMGERILNATTTDLENNDNFVTYFKGIVIKTDPENTPGSGSLVSFYLTSTLSRLKMYYHNTEDTLIYNFGIEASARFNRYDHNGYAEASPDLKAQLINHDTLQGKQKLFIQAFGGTKVKLRFPYLKKWAADKKIAIADAKLIMINADFSPPFEAPTQLALRAILTDSTQGVLVDENEGTSYFDGTYNDSKGYQFRISRYIQQLLNSNNVAADKGLFLFVPGASYFGNRLILNGTATESGRMKLAIRYTRIK